MSNSYTEILRNWSIFLNTHTRHECDRHICNSILRLHSRQSHKFQCLYFNNILFSLMRSKRRWSSHAPKSHQLIPACATNQNHFNESLRHHYTCSQQHFLLIYCLSFDWLRDSKDLCMRVSNWYKKEVSLLEYALNK